MTLTISVVLAESATSGVADSGKCSENRRKRGSAFVCAYRLPKIHEPQPGDRVGSMPATALTRRALAPVARKRAVAAARVRRASASQAHTSARPGTAP